MTTQIQSSVTPAPDASAYGIEFQRPAECTLPVCPALSGYQRELERHERMEADLSNTLLREEELLRRNDMLKTEFEHRMLNSVQMIASVLSMQSRSTDNVEVAAQLKTAANRLVAIGRVQRHLHAFDDARTIQLKRYLEALCHDISGITLVREADNAIVFDGNELAIPSASGTAIGFIVNELIVNALKYAKGKIIVRLEGNLDNNICSVSVSDDGPGLPEGFDPTATKGLGMKIIRSLVKQIDGRMEMGNGENGTGARFTVQFPGKSSES